MISIERVDPANYDHLDRYAELLENSRQVADVADHLPEIFEEGSAQRIQAGIRSTNAMRYFVVVEGLTVGRMELARHLNDDPSIVSRVLESVVLGFNTCYFINPALVGRGLDDVHRRVADKSIREAFMAGDAALKTAPWLPVAPEGDASMGWLMQGDNIGYDVHVDEPKAGIFPQFGIGENAYSIAYATLKQTK